MGHEDYEIVPMEIEDGNFLKISCILPTDSKENLFEFLKKNVDLLAWKPKDMSGINPNIISH